MALGCNSDFIGMILTNTPEILRGRDRVLQRDQHDDILTSNMHSLGAPNPVIMTIRNNQDYVRAVFYFPVYHYYRLMIGARYGLALGCE